MEATMTSGRDRRRDLDDPIARRIAEGEGSGWIPALVGFAFLLGFAYLLFWSWRPSPDNTTRESSIRMERTVPPAPIPKAPN
jgi:hypothetical protein